VFVALYSALFLGEKLSPKSIIAILGALAGCYLMVGAYDLSILSLNRVGILGGFAAALAFATYSLLSEYGMRKYSPWTVLLYGMLFAALLWNVVHTPLEGLGRSYSPAEWWWIFFIGIGGTTVPFGLYFEGVSRIRATHASVTATLEPITAGIMSAIFLGEMLGSWQLLGGGLVIASIVVLQWRSKAKE
jgi:drug/metabolite transporter (DMT)-like permease